MGIDKEIKEFFLKFKNKSIDSSEIISDYKNIIFNFDEKISQEEYINEIQENIFLIYGYTFRLNDLNQRLFYTFSEAINAINMDNLMRNEDGVKLNSFVYVRVLKLIIDEFDGIINEDFKKQALDEYAKLEEKKAKENKYHVYQY